jgi:hypothetical protein
LRIRKKENRISKSRKKNNQVRMGIYGKNSIIWDHNYQTAEHLAQFGYLPSPNFRIPAHNV